jgi:lipopolysaccharide transport system permease protein
MMIVFTIVFSKLAQVPTDGVPYPIFSYVALLPWTFLQTSVSFGVPSLINNLNLVTKSNFPREILPMGAVGASIFDFSIASVIFLFMFLFYQLHLSRTIIWVPILIILQTLIALGTTFLGSAIIVIFRDVRFIVPLALQIWFYASPVIYPVSLVPEQFQSLYMINPMAGIIDSYRRIFLYAQSPKIEYLLVSAIFGIAIFCVGWLVFKVLEYSFADII